MSLLQSLIIDIHLGSCSLMRNVNLLMQLLSILNFNRMTNIIKPRGIHYKQLRLRVVHKLRYHNMGGSANDNMGGQAPAQEGKTLYRVFFRSTRINTTITQKVKRRFLIVLKQFKRKLIDIIWWKRDNNWVKNVIFIDSYVKD